MAENKISGHIFVESEEALRAFEQEIHTLEQAFRDSGFEGATLSTALDYRNSGTNGREKKNSPIIRNVLQLPVMTKLRVFWQWMEAAFMARLL
jgi:hypothetical protein